MVGKQSFAERKDLFLGLPERVRRARDLKRDLVEPHVARDLDTSTDQLRRQTLLIRIVTRHVDAGDRTSFVEIPQLLWREPEVSHRGLAIDGLADRAHVREPDQLRAIEALF